MPSKLTWTTLELSWNTFEIFLNLPWNTLETSLKHPLNFPQTPLKFSRNTLKTSNRHPWDNPETPLQLLQNILRQMLWMLQTKQNDCGRTHRWMNLVTLSLLGLLIAAKKCGSKTKRKNIIKKMNKLIWKTTTLMISVRRPDSIS